MGGRSLDEVAEDWQLDSDSQLLGLLGKVEPQRERESWEDEYERKMRDHYQGEKENPNSNDSILECSDKIEIQPKKLIDLLASVNL